MPLRSSSFHGWCRPTTRRPWPVFEPSSSSADGAFSYLGYVLIYDGVVGQGIRTTITNGDGTKVFGTYAAARCVK